MKGKKYKKKVNATVKLIATDFGFMTCDKRFIIKKIISKIKKSSKTFYLVEDVIYNKIHSNDIHDSIFSAKESIAFVIWEEDKEK